MKLSVHQCDGCKTPIPASQILQDGWQCLQVEDSWGNELHWDICKNCLPTLTIAAVLHGNGN